jgi:ectoine hydroxylase-related dioxygenase (phytanoyl-CoA dioxygenase family)
MHCAKSTERIPRRALRKALRRSTSRTTPSLSSATKLDPELGALHRQLEDNGYAVVYDAISAEVLNSIELKLDDTRAGQRNLLALPVIRELAASHLLHALVEPVLGPNPVAVRGFLFNKQPNANWKVVWHQDSVVAVRVKKNVSGWGPWSVKQGVNHVRPPVEVMERMVALRIHLDNCGALNGPLRVLSGTHRNKFLSDEQIRHWPKEHAVTCIADRGDAILMRPLLLHASSAATVPTSRRVIHIEFAAEDLPGGMEWYERIGCSEVMLTRRSIPRHTGK